MGTSKWILQPGKFLTSEEAGRLISVVRHRAQCAKTKGTKVAIRDYFIIHLALATGLRVMEITALTCGDLFLDSTIGCLLVQKGKGGKRRFVYFAGPFKKHCTEYLDWKRRIGESTESDKPLIVSSNTGTHMTTRAIEKVFKRCAERACLYSAYSIHCLRHTYASYLYKASGHNLRLVQDQLGHSDPKTTEIYVGTLMAEMEETLHRFSTLIHINQ